MTICGVMAILFILSIFINNMTIIFAIATIILLVFLYSAIFSENIKFEVENNILRYYEKKKLIRTLDLTNCTYKYKVSGTNGSTDNIELTIYPQNNEEELLVYCTPIGDTQFYSLLEDIKLYAYEPDNFIETKKKEL